MKLPRIDPLELGRLTAAFVDDDWIFELKHDGFRALAYVEDNDVRLISRTRHVYAQFDDLRGCLAAELDADSAIIDGEIVALDDQGRPVFNDLMRRNGDVVFVAFDLPWIDGEDLRELPLIERKDRLRAIIPKRSTSVLYLGHVEGEGVDLFKLVCEQDLEGVVAKLKRSPYRAPGKRPPWVKIKNAAYSQKEGRHEQFERFKERKQ